MNYLSELTAYVAGHRTLAEVTAGAALSAGTLYAALRGVRALRRRTPARPKSDRLMTFLGAGVATGVVATGMWRFFGDVLGIDAWYLRVGLFAFFEIAMLASALRSRRFRLDHAQREQAEHGDERREIDVDGIAVWVLALLSGAFSASDQSTLPGAALRLVAPVVAAWLWERGLAGELRQYTRKPRTRKIALRLSTERILVWLGIAEPTGREVGEVDKARRLAKLARTAFRLHTLREAKAASWRVSLWTRRLRRQVESANEHLGLATDPAVRAALRAHLATLYQVLSGTGPDAVSDLTPWAAADTTVTGQRSAPLPRPARTAVTASPDTPDSDPADSGEVPDTTLRTVVNLSDASARRAARAGQSEVSVEQLADTLAAEHPGQVVGKPTAQATLKRIYGTCSNDRAIEAKNLHNARLRRESPPLDRDADLVGASA